MFVINILWFNLNKSTASRGAQFSRLLVTARDGSVFGNRLLDDAAHFSGPLCASGAGRVAACLIFAFLLQLSATLSYIILNFMWFLFGPTFRLVFSSADLLSDLVTILDQRFSAHRHSLVESGLKRSIRNDRDEFTFPCSYVMKQVFLKFSSHSSSCWDS